MSAIHGMLFMIHIGFVIAIVGVLIMGTGILFLLKELL